MKPKQAILILLDSSYSMGDTEEKKAAALSGYNEQVAAIQANAKDLDIVACFATFDGRIHEHVWAVPPEELKAATMEEYKLGSATALHAALAYGIEKLRDTVAKDVPKYIITITDGQDNYSNPTLDAKLAALVKECDADGNWTNTFMGCDPDYMKRFCERFGFSKDNAAIWNADTGEKVQTAMCNLARGTERFLRARSIQPTMQRAVNLYEATCDSHSVNGLADYSAGEVKVAAELRQE